jgi:hypothetical protein
MPQTRKFRAQADKTIPQYQKTKCAVLRAKFRHIVLFTAYKVLGAHA